MRVHQRGNFLTVFTGGLALLLGSGRVLAGPAPAVPLETAFELAPEAPPGPVPLRWSRAWMLVKVTLNGADAGWFKLGTGYANSCIDPQVAARLKLPMVADCGLMAGFLDELKGSSPKSYRAEVLQCGAACATDVPLMPCDLAEISQESVKMYGAGISGVLGWDLLKTLPFVLDEPGLQMEWQREATPAAGATRVPVLEMDDRPFIEITIGKGCKVLAMLNTAGAAMAIQQPFLRKHAEQLWDGPVIRHNYTFFGDAPDDADGLPPVKDMEFLRSSRWLAVACGGLQQMLPATIIPHDDPAGGEVQVGTAWLRRMRVLVDGPGKALWLTPASSTPEVELVSPGRPAPSPYLLEKALQIAIGNNDPSAVKALAAAGAAVTGPPERLPLAIACTLSSREAALALVEAGAAVDPEPGRQLPEPPLVCACGSGDLVLIKMLLEQGADPNRATLTGFTPLMAAARTGGPAAVRALRGKARFPTDPIRAGQLLGEACTGGNLLLAKEMLALIPAKAQSNILWPVLLERVLLLGHEELVEWLLLTRGSGLATKGGELLPLLAAIRPTRPEKSDAIRERLVTRLLTAGADPNASCKGVTPLLLAARHGNGAIVRALLAAGAKATAKDYQMRDPLLLAAAANQPPELIAPLLLAGLDLNAVDSTTELSILATYVMHGNLEACTALLAAGADPNAKSPFGFAPLLTATNSSNATDENALAVLSLLLKQGAKLGLAADSKTEPGPFFGAIAKGRSTLLKPLVEAGAPVNQAVFRKVMPLALAAAVANPATLQALLDLGADLKTLDASGLSPLAHAAAAGRTNNMALLLAHGAAPDATGPNEKPPVWVAAAGGQLRAVRALLAAGADPAAPNPETNTTAIAVATARRDQAMVTLLENQPRKK
ncbi:MAG: ankyrin repeat domain-containing protein [Verrucomicrobia bacterium]|nr:ankyrin repeat domain-containing protein [Verrucomicrobiota bacterium]